MTSKFVMTRDLNGFNCFGLKFSDLKYNVTLAQNTDTTFIVPSSMSMGGEGFSSKPLWAIVFSYSPGSNVYVALNNTASSPVGNTFVLTDSDHNPSVREVFGGDVIHCFSSDTSAQVTMLLYSLT